MTADFCFVCGHQRDGHDEYHAQHGDRHQFVAASSVGKEGAVVSERTIRTLHLERDEDVSGISGTGIVAYGVEFPDGSVVLRWDTKVRSTVFYDSIQDVETITGHGGRTRIVFEPADLSNAKAEIARLRMFEEKVTHGLPGAWILTAEEHDRVYGILAQLETGHD